MSAVKTEPKKLIAAGVLLAVSIWFFVRELHLDLSQTSIPMSAYLEMAGFFALGALLCLVAMWIVVRFTRASYPPNELLALALPTLAIFPEVMIVDYVSTPFLGIVFLEELLRFALFILLFHWALKQALLFSAVFVAIRLLMFAVFSLVYQF